MRSNPLILETVRGLLAPGTPQPASLMVLLLPAAALLLWWPKARLVAVLQSYDSPDTLLAVLIALGVSVAWHGVRLGGEEILLPGQHGLQDWVIATPLSLSRIMVGFVLAHLLELAHLLLLVAPFPLLAMAVSGSDWAALGWSVAALTIQAVFYRLLACLIYLRIGHHDTASFICVRAVLVVGYGVSAFALPMANHMVLSSRLLAGELGIAGATHAAQPWVFLTCYTVAALVLVAIIYHRLWMLRCAQDGETSDAR